MTGSAMVSGGVVLLSLGAVVISAQARPPAHAHLREARTVPIVGWLHAREGTVSLTAQSISEGGEAHGYFEGVAVEIADVELAEQSHAEASRR